MTRSWVDAVLQSIIGVPVDVHHLGPVAGGDINEAYRIDCSGARYFLKANSRKDNPNMLAKEARGLDALRGKSGFRIPECIGHLILDDRQYLLLEWMDMKPLGIASAAEAGRALASLHEHRSQKYGWEEDNYIGKVKQRNTWRESAVDFFIQERLRPMLELRDGMVSWTSKDRKDFEALFGKLPDLLPDEPASLIHGDLWSGNIAELSQGGVCVFDPALCYGQAEQDLAMTRLFGGFPAEFYAAYNEARPALSRDWRRRGELWNLYPLMAHAQLFGGNYINSVRSVLRAYV